MDPHTKIGQILMELEAEHAAHVQTVGLLRRLISGAVALDRISVTPNDKWVIAPELAEVPAPDEDKESRSDAAGFEP